MVNLPGRGHSQAAGCTCLCRHDIWVEEFAYLGPEWQTNWIFVLDTSGGLVSRDTESQVTKHFNKPTLFYLLTKCGKKDVSVFVQLILCCFFFFWHITNNDYTGTHLNGKSTDFNYLSLKLPGCVALGELLLCASISSSVEWVRVVSTAYDYCKAYESYCISHQEHCLALCVLS